MECEAAKAFEYEFDSAVNREAYENAMLITVLVPFFPFAQEASDWIDVAYGALEETQVRARGFFVLEDLRCTDPRRAATAAR